MSNHWITQRRKKLGMTQDELAAKLQASGINVTRPTISHWENSRHNVPLKDPVIVAAMADALRMSTNSLLEAAGYGLSRHGISDAAQRAADIVDRLPPSRQQLALGILEQLASDTS